MTQHVRALPRSRKLSAPELPKPRPKFAWERFGSIKDELPPLFMEHWRELALNQDVVPLDPSWDQYFAYDIQGRLAILTVRFEGKLVGYLFLIVGPHLHYASTPWGHTDMFWLDPIFRQGWTGVRMFKELIRGGERFKAKVLTVPIKLHFMNARVGKLLERLGFKAIETVYSRKV